MTEDDARDVRRWVMCGVVVLCAHGAVAGLLSRMPDGIPAGSPPDAVIVDLQSPGEEPAEELTDLPDGPKQEENTQPPEPPVEQKVEEQIPEAPNAEVAIVTPPPQPEPPPPEPVKQPRPPEIKPQVKKPPAPKTTAPKPKTRVATASPSNFPTPPSNNPAARSSWNSQILSQIERNKRYPSDAQSRGDQGVTKITFSLDRSGRVLSAHIAGGSGFAALDQESLATVRRASPFPHAPLDVSGSTFSFTVPIRYKK